MGVTVKVVEPDMPPNEALIVVVPTPTAVAFPLESMVATEVSDELHVTDDVRSWVVLPENVPVAANCLIVPAVTLGTAGVTAMD